MSNRKYDDQPTIPRHWGHGRGRPSKDFSPTARSAAGRYTRMFRRAGRPDNILPIEARVADKLQALGEEMANKPPGDDAPFAAGYTYWGQLIDHDITLDTTSQLVDDNGRPRRQKPSQTLNFRTPALDLDCVYGRGPAVDPYLYASGRAAPQRDHGKKLLLGENRDVGPNEPGGSTPTDADVPRNSAGTALIGDPRNDENLAVSQLQMALLKFHNAMVDKLRADGVDEDELFMEARRETTWHYQYAIRHDFLPTVCDDEVVEDVFRNGRQFFVDNRRMQMPVEFSVAAYRFGHALIRERYRVNGVFTDQPLSDLFGFVRVPRVPVFSNWVVNFNSFFETQNLPANQLNKAKAVDANLSAGLNGLPDEMQAMMRQLGGRNLRRGLVFRLPTGQAIAKLMGERPLSRNELLEGTSAREAELLRADNCELLDKTPLWYYILKESEIRAGGRHVGAVGSRIIAEVFQRMLTESKNAYLNQNRRWTPSIGDGEEFGMIDILEFAGVV